MHQNNIDLNYVSDVLGTTNFKIIHGDTGIIMFDANRQFSRRLSRTMQPHSKGKQPSIKSISIIRKLDRANLQASIDAMSKEELRQYGRTNRTKRARIVHNHSKPLLSTR